MDIFFMVGFSAFAFLLGGAMRDSVWRSNARHPMRICSKNSIYKVVKLDDPKSWEFLNIHSPELDNLENEL